MTQYLDKVGLTYLWGKIKSKFLMGNSGGVFYGTCSTAAGTVAKVVDCADFTADNLKAGTIIIVTFTATNSGAVANLTMDVNGTGAKHIKYINNGTLGNLSSAGYLKANTEYPFYYDGTNWVCWFNVNTTYSVIPENEIHTGTSTSARLITAQRLKQAVQYHAPVKSVNGSTGDVTISVPTKTSELTNDGDGTSGFVTGNDVTDLVGLSLLTPIFCATDATTRAVLQQAFGASAAIVVPSDITSTASLLSKLEPRTWFAWMNGAELEFARLSVSVNVSNNAITLYLRGRTSMATGIMGVDSSWTITALASDGDVDLFYPVGSYYETSDASFDPNTAWGGTWVLEAEGQVHIGAGSNYTIGDEGGEATHTLTIDEMPSHTHNLPNVMGYVNSTGGGNGTYGAVATWATVGATGGGQAHNIMQPYIVVNRWHRTA